MRRFTVWGALGWTVFGLGALVVLVGVALAVVLGPDSRRTTGPHKVQIDGSVFVTAPRVVNWADVQIDVLAEVPAKKPIFVGVGNTVDVEAYVGNVRRVEVTKYSRPWDLSLTERRGELPTVQGAPTSLDWWIDSAAGLGGASMSTNLPDEPVSMAVVAIGSSSLSGLQVTFAYGIKGGFLKGIGLVLVGSGLMLGGSSLRRIANSIPRSVPRTSIVNSEEVRYIWVDEDGVEHELTEAELESGDYEIADDQTADDQTADDQTADDQTAESDGAERPVVDQISRGAPDRASEEGDGPDRDNPDQDSPDGDNPDSVSIQLPPDDAALSATTDPVAAAELDAAESSASQSGAPRYIWIDDDGVEHELTEAELAELDDYEIIDERDQT